MKSVSDWYQAALEDVGVMDDHRCPRERFTPQEWLEMIVLNPIAAQYCPIRDEVCRISSKDDFAFWNSYDICCAIFLDGTWLLPFLDLSEIEQEDFDNTFGTADEYENDAEYRENIGAFFDGKIPSHLIRSF